MITKVTVTGDIQVPAGAADIDEDFAVDTGWTKGVGWTIPDPADCDGTQVADSDLVIDVPPLTAGKTYLIILEMTRAAGTLTPVVGTALGTARATSDTFTELLVANGTAFTLRADSAFVGTVPSVLVYELVTGPIDEYLWDKFTDFTSGAEPLGIYNGERVYKSILTHADGAGGADVNYYVRQRISNNFWYITKTSPLSQDATVDPRWFNATTLIADFAPVGNAPPSTGTATVTEGHAPMGYVPHADEIMFESWRF
jgi:hypothetical protein